MPKYAVLMHIPGPFQFGEDTDQLDGAYTHRFVVAKDAEAARQVAIDELRGESAFRDFHMDPDDLEPRIEVQEVRPAKWREGLGKAAGFTFYRETEDE